MKYCTVHVHGLGCGTLGLGPDGPHGPYRPCENVRSLLHVAVTRTTGEAALRAGPGRAWTLRPGAPGQAALSSILHSKANKLSPECSVC